VLRSLQHLLGYTLRARDGDIGQVTDLYFDDQHWVVRYLVADTPGWLGREVLIAPPSFGAADWHDRAIDVALTRAQVRDSPSIDRHRPVSRQYEARYYAYFGYSPYWGPPSGWGGAAPGAGAMPDGTLASRRAVAAADDAARAPAPGGKAGGEPPSDFHLRSMSEVTGYHLHASDGEIGHVDDFIADDTTWAIRYLEVDTSNWIGGRSVLVPRAALRDVDWSNRLVGVALTRERIAHAPPSGRSPSAAEEAQLLAYYAADDQATGAGRS
jgi:hypothetical protein